MKKSEIRKIIREEIEMLEVTSAGSEGGMANHDEHSEKNLEKIKKEVFENEINSFIKTINEYANNNFSEEIDNKNFMKRMQIDLKKIIKIILDWKKVR